MHSRRSSTLLLIGIVAAVYFIAGKLGLKLAFLNASASAVWPPSGIALAVLLLLGYRVWPAIFLGAFLVNYSTAGSVPTSLGIAAGNTLESLVGAWLVYRFAGGPRVFDRAQGVFKFALAAGLSTLISPTLGLTSLALGGYADWTRYGEVWMTWWLGDFAGDLVIAPLVLLWGIQPRWHFDRETTGEVTALFVLLVVLAETVFGGWFPIFARNYPIAFICGPIIIWIAFRFTQRETATGIFILGAIALWGTLHGYGPFVMENGNQSLLVLQGWAAVLTLTSMTLAAAMAERRRAEAVIEEQKSAVEAANRTKDNFLAMLSHELRTPLTPVVAALEALKSEPLDTSESKAALAMIRRNIDLESQLIDDLLDLTRITSDKLQLQLEPLDAHQAIANVLEMCGSELNNKQLHLSLDLRAEDHHLAADAPKFQQIIWNLLKNAIKFTGENGAITISSSSEAPGSLTIRVTDTGIGIEPEMMERIFNRFEQGDRSFQRRFGGLGLGLTISKSLTEGHGGTLLAESEGRDRGASFLLTFKTVPAPEPFEKSHTTRAAAGRRSLRILLVDDHLDTSAALKRLLTRQGHVVAAAHDVRSAIETAGRDQFDLLISDVGLPDGSGLELMRRLRAATGIRGIAISGFGMNGDVEKSLQAGFFEHLVKPVNLEKLEAAIDHAMSGAERTAALPGEAPGET
jgi:signal transduction histidine kinase/ActR/RegA family two-component response regulator